MGPAASPRNRPCEGRSCRPLSGFVGTLSAGHPEDPTRRGNPLGRRTHTQGFCLNEVEILWKRASAGVGWRGETAAPPCPGPRSGSSNEAEQHPRGRALAPPPCSARARSWCSRCSSPSPPAVVQVRHRTGQRAGRGSGTSPWGGQARSPGVGWGRCCWQGRAAVRGAGTDGGCSRQRGALAGPAAGASSRPGKAGGCLGFLRAELGGCGLQPCHGGGSPRGCSKATSVLSSSSRTV